MIVRSLLALMLCPGLGILSGAWLGRQATLLVRAARFGASEVNDASLVSLDIVYGAGLGCVAGLIFAVMLIWCARRGHRSTQRALADLLVVALSLLFIADCITYMGLVPRAAELWPKLLAANAGVWLLGLLLTVLAVRNAVARPTPAGAEA